MLLRRIGAWPFFSGNSFDSLLGDTGFGNGGLCECPENFHLKAQVFEPSSAWPFL